jgi:hypothetical protein
MDVDRRVVGSVMGCAPADLHTPKPQAARPAQPAAAALAASVAAYEPELVVSVFTNIS